MKNTKFEIIGAVLGAIVGLCVGIILIHEKYGRIGIVVATSTFGGFFVGMIIGVLIDRINNRNK